MKSHVLAIIIPAYNEGEYISKCLDSFVRDNYPKDLLEILIIDGGSTDNTKKIVNEYSKKYPFIKLFENPNRVTPYALNIGIKKMRKEILFFMRKMGKKQIWIFKNQLNIFWD